ncbi:hypothetical protein LLG10_08140 [bacterium]|nr:hypothetical protein [bacterium]
MVNWTKITDATRHYLKQVFQSDDLILSYTDSHTPGMMTPVVIRKAEDIDSIILNPICTQNLAVYLSEFFQNDIQTGKPVKGKWYITVKPCDVRSVIQMMADEQILKEHIELIVFDCDGTVTNKNLKELFKSEIRKVDFNDHQAKAETLLNEELTADLSGLYQVKCSDREICSIPAVNEFTFIGERERFEFSGTAKNTAIIQDTLTQEECFEKVSAELSKCIRCNACRNICPACFCSDRCVMDKPKLSVPYITKEITLDQIFQYHLIRFYHVAPNCTACGECERICPQGISLSIFYKYLHRMNKHLFGDESGSSDSDRQKLLSYRFGEDLV